MNFVGEARKITDLDLPRIGYKIGVGEDEVHALIDVEANGAGFDKHGRPKMLFEPHIFYRQLSGSQRDEAIARGLAYKRWGTKRYPTDSYPRLEEAMKINKEAALKSASWGMGQIMGFNHQACGFETAEEMVIDFMVSEGRQLRGMINFLIFNKLDDDLREHRWDAFARGYNGPGYAKHGYHTKLRKAYEKWSKIKDTEWSPEMDEAPIVLTPDLVVNPELIKDPIAEAVAKQKIEDDKKKKSQHPPLVLTLLKFLVKTLEK